MKKKKSKHKLDYFILLKLKKLSQLFNIKNLFNVLNVFYFFCA